MRSTRKILMRDFALVTLTLLTAGCAIGTQWRELDGAPQEIVQVAAMESYEITPDDSNWGRMFGNERLPGIYYAHNIAFADGSVRRFDMKARYFVQGTCLAVKRTSSCTDQCLAGLNLQIISTLACPSNYSPPKNTQIIR